MNNSFLHHHVLVTGSLPGTIQAKSELTSKTHQIFLVFTSPSGRDRKLTRNDVIKVDVIGIELGIDLSFACMLCFPITVLWRTVSFKLLLKHVHMYAQKDKGGKKAGKFVFCLKNVITVTPVSFMVTTSLYAQLRKDSDTPNDLFSHAIKAN